MKIKSKRCIILLLIFFFGIIFINIDSIKSPLNHLNHEKLEESEDIDNNFINDKIGISFGGYSSSSDGNFDVIENVSSRIDNRDFLATEGNYFHQAIPLNWTVNSMQFNIESYSKEQKIIDSTFDIDEDDSPWYEQAFENGKGSFSQSFEPDNDHPDYVRTTIYNFRDREEGETAFYEGNYALWNQDLKERCRNTVIIKVKDRDKVLKLVKGIQQHLVVACHDQRKAMVSITKEMGINIIAV